MPRIDIAPRPKLLDYYCCGGGASRGYDLAGFDVYGLDFADQSAYPYPFHQGDALNAMGTLIDGGSIRFWSLDGTHVDLRLEDFAAWVGSPPCQYHTSLKSTYGDHVEHLDLVPETRAMFEISGKPWIIENVETAPLIDPLVLCGSMFYLGTVCRDDEYRYLKRHRKFESNIELSAPGVCRHVGQAVGVYGNGGSGDGTTFERRGYQAVYAESARALGIDWMPTKKSLSQAIPPAYTQWLGQQLIRVV